MRDQGSGIGAEAHQTPWHVWAVALSLTSIVVTNAYDLSAGTSRALANGFAAIVTVIIFVIAVLEFTYARAMKKRAVLK